MSDQRGSGSDDPTEGDAIAADGSSGTAARPTGKRTTRRARATDASGSESTPSLSKDAPKTTAGKSVATAPRVAGRTRAEAAPKMNIFKRLRKFLREVIAELRKVIWPNRKQMVTYTAVVLVFVTFMVAYISGLDLAFIRGVQWLFG